MDLTLNETDIRVLGALVEKQIATPEYYPLSLNALMHACNQKTNRDPVVSYDEETVTRSLGSLREKKLVWMFKGADSRVLKYGHIFPEAFDLNDREVAVMCVLMLRGPQTVGELRSRTGHLHSFEDLSEVEATLRSLADRDGEPLVVKLPRQAGFKESRYAHLLGGPVDVEALESAPMADFQSSKSHSLSERVSLLQVEVEALRRDLAEMREQFQEFRKQFE
jgi:uncharacterized protein YceH (UPF0502 family)